MRRYGPGAWISRLSGYSIPGDDGDKYCPRGYTFADVGPYAFSGKGRKGDGPDSGSTNPRKSRAMSFFASVGDEKIA